MPYRFLHILYRLQSCLNRSRYGGGIVLMDGQSFCLPTGGTPQDVLKGTVSFMQAHPDQKQYLLASVMVAAVRAQWPCRSK
jgi:hypothetical protein